MPSPCLDRRSVSGTDLSPAGQKAWLKPSRAARALQASIFTKGADGRSISGSLEKVPLPVPGHQSLICLRWSQMNAGQVRHLPLPVTTSRARLARSPALVQQSDQFPSEFPFGVA